MISDAKMTIFIIYFYFFFRMSDVLSGTGVATKDPKNIHDMTAFIQHSLTDMQGKFTNMSDQVVHRKCT